MNCPRCRIRQLDESLICRDCATRWSQKQLEFFWKQDAILIAEYSEEIRLAQKKLGHKRESLLKATLERHGKEVLT